MILSESVSRISQGYPIYEKLGYLFDIFDISHRYNRYIYPTKWGPPDDLLINQGV